MTQNFYFKNINSFNNDTNFFPFGRQMAVDGRQPRPTANGDCGGRRSVTNDQRTATTPAGGRWQWRLVTRAVASDWWMVVGGDRWTIGS